MFPEADQPARLPVAQHRHRAGAGRGHARAGKTLAVSDQALELVVTQGYNLAFGARFLKRVIDERIKLPISSLWKDGSHFDVTVKNGEVVVEPGPARVPDADGTVAA